MNKHIIPALVLGVGLSLAGFTSCKKCMKCEYVETASHIPRQREHCGGNAAEREAFKDDVIKEAGFFGVTEEQVKCSTK